MAWIGAQVLPLTEATSSRTCGATERIWRSTPAQVAGTGGEAAADPAGCRSSPLIMPVESTAMVTVSLDCPSAVTVMTRVLGVAIVIASSRRLVTPARAALSCDGVTCARNALSKWAVTSAPEIGGCAAVARSQRAWTPTGLLGTVTAETGDVGGADDTAGVTGMAAF